jgi:hypothetical protein
MGLSNGRPPDSHHRDHSQTHWQVVHVVVRQAYSNARHVTRGTRLRSPSFMLKRSRAHDSSSLIYDKIRLWLFVGKMPEVEYDQISGTLLKSGLLLHIFLEYIGSDDLYGT